MYIINYWFDPPSNITVLPQSYTVHCIIAGKALTSFRYYYVDTPDVHLISTYCSSQTGYDCWKATEYAVTSEMTPDTVVDKTITVTWKAEEVSSGAFRQDNNNGDHMIKCHARRGNKLRELIITVKGKYSFRLVSY